MRNAGDVAYADAHKKVRNEAYVFEFDCCGGRRHEAWECTTLLKIHFYYNQTYFFLATSLIIIVYISTQI